MTIDELGVTGFDLDGTAAVRLTRVVAAPRDLVFTVHTSPQHLPHWLLGPPGWTMPVCEIDLRPGGAFRYVWRAEDGGEMTIAGTFEEVARPERIVSTESWGGDWPATRNTVTFDDLGGRTRITTRIDYASPAAREQALNTRMREGLDAGFERLDAYLALSSMRLELVPVPVKDVDAAIAFYAGKLGWNVDHDLQPAGGPRIVQVTPPGSACSILLSRDLPDFDLPPGILRGLHLVVNDVGATRAALLARGVEASEVMDMGGILYVHLADPDGNSWLLQEIPPGVGRPDDL